MESKMVLSGTKKGSPMGTPFWNPFFSKSVLKEIPTGELSALELKQTQVNCLILPQCLFPPEMYFVFLCLVLIAALW